MNKPKPSERLEKLNLGHTEAITRGDGAIIGQSVVSRSPIEDVIQQINSIVSILDELHSEIQSIKNSSTGGGTGH